jgi:hypothetical protein
MKHKIALGTLVEVDYESCENHGIRAFIVYHFFDFDGTPLYGLGMSKDIFKYIKTGNENYDSMISASIEKGFSESMLKEIKG